MTFQINALSPVRAFCQAVRGAAAIYRVSANIAELAARGVEAVTSPVAFMALAGHLAPATAPLVGVVPVDGDAADRAAKLEIGLRRDIHGDVPAAAPAPCPGKSRSARRRAKARAAKAAEERAKAPFWTEERQDSFVSAFGKA